MEQLIVKM